MEMQFIFYVFSSMSKVKASFTDDSKKKDQFGATLLKKISEFIDKSYSNKIIASRFFASKLIPFKKDTKVASSTVLKAMDSMHSTAFQEKLGELLLPLYTVKEMRSLVIE